MLGIHDKVDIVFALDGSDGVSRPSFEAQKDFVKGTLKAYQLAPGKARAGVFTYGSKALKNVEVKEGVSRLAIDSDLRNAGLVNGTRDVTSAIRFAGSDMFVDATSRSRKKLLVMIFVGRLGIEDGKDLMTSLDELKKKGIEILFIGVEQSTLDKRLFEKIAKDTVRQITSMDRINTKLTDVVEASEKLTGWHLSSMTNDY